MQQINILLVDDHRVLRKGLALLLESQPNYKIVADVSSAQEAIDFAEKGNVNLMITDISMPEIDGIELLKIFKDRFPAIQTIVLSMHLDDHHIVDAVNAGAHGYLVKDSSEDAIIDAVKTVADGGIYLTPSVSQVLARALLQGREEEKVKETFHLTSREQEILQCITNGLSNKMIGAQLSISERTVNAHRYNIMRKLNAHNTADLVRIAFTNKLLA